MILRALQKKLLSLKLQLLFFKQVLGLHFLCISLIYLINLFL